MCDCAAYYTAVCGQLTEGDRWSEIDVECQRVVRHRVTYCLSALHMSYTLYIFEPYLTVCVHENIRMMVVVVVEMMVVVVAEDDGCGGCGG